MSSLKLVKNRLLAWLAVAMMTGSPALWANELTDIGFSTLPGNRVQISLTLAEGVQNPASFATDNPARIAIDLPGTTSAVKRKVTPIGVGVARSVAAIEASDRTRVVINLLESVPYEIRTEGRQLLVDIGGAEGASQMAAGKPGAASSSARPVASSHQVANIDFRRGPADEGRVEIDLSDPSVVVDMRQEGGKIILELLDTGLPPALARTLDVTDFATPVREIVTRPDGGNTRMEIATQGDFEHLAYQTDNTYTVEFRALSRVEIERKRLEQEVYEGERLSLNFQDIEVRSVLQILGDFTGLNMVISDTVGGSITLRLKNVPWDQAMDIILKTRGLSKRQTDNVILIAPTEEIAAREKLELESRQQIETLAPLRSELIQINYAKAADLAALMKSGENRLLTERGNVTVDDRTNSLLIQDTAAKLGEIRELIGKLDIPVRQVLIESRVVLANNDFSRDLGVKLGMAATDQNVGTTNNQFLVGGNVLDNDVPGTGAITADNLLVNLPSIGRGPSASGAVLNFVLGKIGSHLLALEIDAMQQEGRGEVISSPRIITSDQNTAIIRTGKEVPYTVRSADGTPTTELIEALLKLEVTPQITPDDRIIMDLVVQKDEPDFANRDPITGAIPLDRREAKTNVLVDNGETVVLGGVFERSKGTSIGRVPFFGDLPYVGWAFKREQTEDSNSELLIFVTPRILKDSLTLR